MSKSCQVCGYQNGDDRYLCQRCGEFLDDNARVLRQYEKMKQKLAQTEQKAVKQDQDDDFIPIQHEKKQVSHVGLWVLLCAIVIVVGIVAWVLLA